MNTITDELEKRLKKCEFFTFKHFDAIRKDYQNVDDRSVEDLVSAALVFKMIVADRESRTFRSLLYCDFPGSDDFDTQLEHDFWLCSNDFDA